MNAKYIVCLQDRSATLPTIPVNPMARTGRGTSKTGNIIPPIIPPLTLRTTPRRKRASPHDIPRIPIPMAMISAPIPTSRDPSSLRRRSQRPVQSPEMFLKKPDRNISSVFYIPGSNTILHDT
jgi:hypothetical protein